MTKKMRIIKFILILMVFVAGILALIEEPSKLSFACIWVTLVMEMGTNFLLDKGNDDDNNRPLAA